MNARSKLPAILAVVAIGIATLLLFQPLFVGFVRGQPRFFEWDVPEQYWGDLVFLCRSIHHFKLPYWNPFDRGGYPYYADPQSAAYHPLAWGMCALAGESPSLAWEEARVVIGFVCAGLFALLWLRRLGASWQASTLGAVIVEAAPFMRHNWELNLTSALAWLPMVLWSLERALTLRRARDAALLALAEGLLVWSGSPPVAWFAGSFTALYAMGRIVEILRAESRPSWWPVMRTLAIAIVLAIGLSAVVLVPGLTLAKYSVQAGRSYESLSEGGLALSDEAALLWPHDGNHLYVGLVALVLAPFAFFRRAALPGRWALALAVVLAALLVLGDHGPVFHFAFSWVPGARLFRLPHRYEAWLGPAFGALAAGGYDAVRERVASRWSAAGAPLESRAFALVATIAIPLIVILDVSRRMPSERHTRPRPAPGGADVAAAILPRAPDTQSEFRYFDEFGISCRSGTRLEHRDFRGYQDPLLLEAYERVMSSLAEHPALVMQFNVRYLLTAPHFIHGWDHHYLPRPEVLLGLPGAIDRGEGVIELPAALPFAYVVPKRDVDHVVRREDALAGTIARAPAPIAIVEDGRNEPGSGAIPQLVRADVKRFDTDAVTLDATSVGDGVLVVNETWYPGWHAWVDGTETPVVRANGLVRAVAVGPGHHEVTMRFEPSDGAPLRWLLLGSWVVVLALLIEPLRRARSGAR
ncbi:hypothetical protein BH09MYX1_BH09MYX1_64400 [soil metagenome]